MKKTTHKKKRIDLKSMLVVGAICGVLLLAAGFLIKIFLTDSGPRKKMQISSITLLKPPEQQEKPPEPPPEMPKPQQQQMEAPTQQMDAPQNNQPQDNTPAGQDLGVDAEGGAGGDGFGLVGRKGGRSIIGGGGGGGGFSLMAKYGWYTKKVQDEIWSRMKKTLDENGGIPKGKHKAVVWVQLDSKGSVLQFKIVNSSGNDKVDAALRQSLPSLRVSSPLPEGMPQGMTIRVSSQG